MRWVSASIMTKVLPNPFKEGELMKEGVARKIFNDIKAAYLLKYQNTWNESIIPLDFFAKEFSKRTGQKPDDIVRVFEDFFEKKERDLYEN